VPAPTSDDARAGGEPSDDELLRFLDGALSPDEESALEARIAASPLASARLEILADALAEHDATDDANDDHLPD
jgi:anti-sigma factor RsiW